MAETLNVEVRRAGGKRNAKRLRLAGSVPAVLYGHGEKTISLTVKADQIASALRHGSRMVDLAGGVNESALIRALQWDVYGTHVVHVDFTRVSKDERIEVMVPVELRGAAPGVKNGGVVQHLVHEVLVECLAAAIPDKIQVNVNHLELHGTITNGQLVLPTGVKLLAAAELICVQCVEPSVEVEAAPPTEGAEPEVIGAKKDEEEED